jgi:hypothetical protein
MQESIVQGLERGLTKEESQRIERMREILKEPQIKDIPTIVDFLNSNKIEDGRLLNELGETKNTVLCALAQAFGCSNVQETVTIIDVLMDDFGYAHQVYFSDLIQRLKKEVK